MLGILLNTNDTICFIVLGVCRTVLKHEDGKGPATDMDILHLGNRSIVKSSKSEPDDMQISTRLETCKYVLNQFKEIEISLKGKQKVGDALKHGL